MGITLWIIMIILAIAGIVSAITCCFMSDNYWLLIGGLGIVAIVPLTYCMVYREHLKTEYEYSYSYDIYAIEDNIGIKGSRFYFEQEARYYHIADYKGGKKLYNIPASNSYIIEDRNATPHIEVYRSLYQELNWLEKQLYGDGPDFYEYKIVVPEKTVQSKFNVDLKN